MGEKMSSSYYLRSRKDKSEQMSNLKEHGNANDSVRVSGNNKRASKRVSFASSNLVKKFAIDSEKNTVWDSTYEEKIDSESAHSIEDVQQKRVPSIGDSRRSIYFNLYGGEDIECDLTLSDDKVTNSGVEVQNAEYVRKKSYLSEIESPTFFNDVDMQISKKANGNTTCVEECAMEFTQVIIKKNSPLVIDLNETDLNNTSMEYTCKLSVHNTKTTSVGFNKTIAESKNMELTQGIFPNVFTSEQTNATILAHTDMEQTCLFKNKPLIKITNTESVTIDLTENDVNNTYLKENIQNNTGDQKILNETTTIRKLRNRTNSIANGTLNSSCNDVKSINNTDLKLLSLNNVNVNIRPSLSVCTDDTQQLINYNITNRKSNFSNLQGLNNINSDEVPVSLENTQEDKDNNKLIGLHSTYLVSNSVDIVEWNKGKSSEDVSSLPKLCNSESPTEFHISQESLILTDALLLNDSKSIPDLPGVVETAKEEPIFSHDQISSCGHIWENYKKNNESLNYFIENSNRKIMNSLECMKSLTDQLKALCGKEVGLLKKIYASIDSQENESNSISRETSDSSLCSDRNFNIQDTREESDTVELSLSLDEVLSIKEQIERKYSGLQKFLEIAEIADESCSISTLFGSIRIKVHFTKYDGIVKEIHIRDHLLKNCEPIALLLYTNFIEHLKEQNLRLVVGEKYDILSLLYYIRLHMQKYLNILKQYKSFEIEFNCHMDIDFRAKFCIITMKKIYYIYVDMADFDNISRKSITFPTDFDNINNEEVETFLNKSNKGFIFLKSFLRDYKNYVLSN